MKLPSVKDKIPWIVWIISVNCNFFLSMSKFCTSTIIAIRYGNIFQDFIIIQDWIWPDASASR